MMIAVLTGLACASLGDRLAAFVSDRVCEECEECPSPATPLASLLGTWVETWGTEYTVNASCLLLSLWRRATLFALLRMPSLSMSHVPRGRQFTETEVRTLYAPYTVGGVEYVSPPIKVEVSASVTNFIIGKAIENPASEVDASGAYGGYFPGMWNRFDWRMTADGLRFCNTIYNGTSLASVQLLKGLGGEVSVSYRIAYD